MNLKFKLKKWIKTLYKKLHIFDINIDEIDENIQQEVVAIATEAYNEKIDSIIAEAKARITFEPKFQALRESGATILDENFVIESNNTYVEYTVDKDNIRTHYVHTGTVEKK